MATVAYRSAGGRGIDNWMIAAKPSEVKECDVGAFEVQP
jgi:hypothetical protein